MESKRVANPYVRRYVGRYVCRYSARTPGTRGTLYVLSSNNGGREEWIEYHKQYRVRLQSTEYRRIQCRSKETAWSAKLLRCLAAQLIYPQKASNRPI